MENEFEIIGAMTEAPEIPVLEEEEEEIFPVGSLIL